MTQTVSRADVETILREAGHPVATSLIERHYNDNGWGTSEPGFGFLAANPTIVRRVEDVARRLAEEGRIDGDSLAELPNVVRFDHASNVAYFPGYLLSGNSIHAGEDRFPSVAEDSGLEGPEDVPAAVGSHFQAQIRNAKIQALAGVIEDAVGQIQELLIEE